MPSGDTHAHVSVEQTGPRSLGPVRLILKGSKYSIQKGYLMNAKTHFQKHYIRLKREAILLSLLRGLTVGLACGFVSLLVLWFTSLDGLVISAAVTVGVTILGTLAFYFFKHKPTVKSSAKRIDSLGLEERLLTMVELENENSVMANLQREDAKRALSSVAPSQIRFKPKKRTLILLIVTGVLFAAMLTVSILSALGLMPSGHEIIGSAVDQAQEVYISVTYEAEDGGYIQGESDQLVLAGSDAEPVRAVADEGFIFVEWDDGYQDPERADRNISSDVVFVAIFEPIEEEGDDDGDGDGEEKPSDEPTENEEKSETGQPDDEQSSSGNGAKYEDKNQIIDGKTYYREVLDIYKDLLRERLEKEGDSRTEDEKAIIESYLGIV